MTKFTRWISLSMIVALAAVLSAGALAEDKAKDGKTCPAAKDGKAACCTKGKKDAKSCPAAKDGKKDEKKDEKK